MAEYVPNIEKCVQGCVFWRNGGGGHTYSTIQGICHHMLDTHMRRIVAADGECMSFSLVAPRRKEEEEWQEEDDYNKEDDL